MKLNTVQLPQEGTVSDQKAVFPDTNHRTQVNTNARREAQQDADEPDTNEPWDTKPAKLPISTPKTAEARSQNSPC